MRSYLLTFVLSAFFGFLATPAAARLAVRLGALDRSGERPIPRIGGLAIVTGAVLGAGLLALCFLPTRLLLLSAWHQLHAVVLGAVLILGIGLVDDVVRLHATPKLAVEVLVAIGLYAAGVRIGTLWLPFGIVELGEVVGIAFTVLWIVGIANAFNLLDGLDGAAAGSAVFALLAMFVTSLTLHQPMVAFLTVALAGATVGFLPFNFAPARVYLGDGGSLFLGYALAALAIEGATKGPAIVAIAIPLVAFGLPVADTLLAVVRRGARGAPLMTGDHGHVHHRLLDLGLTARQAAVVLYGVSAAFALASMLFLNPNVRGMAVGLTIVGIGVWLAVRFLRLHELAELARLARRGLTQGRAISSNVEVRKAADALRESGSWEAVALQLARLFQAAEFDRVRLVLQAAGGGARREFTLEEGAIVEGAAPPAADEWGVHLPFQVGPTGAVDGELAVFRRYGRPPLLTDINVLVEILRPALVEAARRVAPPAV